MTSKERAEYRSQANSLKPVTQIGKSGITDAFIQTVNEALTAKELIKVRVLLESSPVKPKEAADQIAGATGADVIGVVGGVIILYRYSQELHDKEKEKKANIRRAQKISQVNAKRREKIEKNRNFRGHF